MTPTGSVGKRNLDRIRRIALALPEVSERLSHGVPCFFVKGKRPVCYFHDHHNGDGRISLWCPALPGVPDELVSTEPDRFFRRPTSASGAFSNWLGVFLDTPSGDGVDWGELAIIIEDAYRIVAPATLVARLGTK
jgi:hypothetical protein